MSGLGLERAEISQSRRHERRATPVQKFKVDAAILADTALQYLPRIKSPIQLLSSAAALAAGTSVAQEAFNIFTNSNVRITRAADEVCKNPVLPMTFLYGPDPDKSPNGKVVTTESFVIPIDVPEFKQIELLYRPDPQSPPSDKNPQKVISIDIDRVGDHGEGKVTTIEEKCNTTVGNKPGLSLEWRNQNDAPDYCEANGEKARKPLVLANGEPGYVVSGRVVEPATIDSLVKSTSVTELRKVGTIVIERTAQAIKIRPRFSAPEDKGKEYFAFFKQRAADIKAISENVKKKEVECSKPQNPGPAKPNPDKGASANNPDNTEAKNKLLASIQDESKREEVRKNIEEKGNSVEDPYRYESPVLGALRRVFNWKW